MNIFYSSKFTQFNSPGHPESPERVKNIASEMKKNKSFSFITPSPAKLSDISRVHTSRLINAVKSGDFFDADTPALPDIYEFAALAAGSAIEASESALSVGRSFSLARPPGHHAGRDFLGGFCYFNNMAIACLRLVRAGRRVAILDIDVHHGNGTEDIVAGNKDIIFCSLHQSRFYPGTGSKSFDNCHNYPLPAGTDFKSYKQHLVDALEKIELFQPEIIGVSVGFDTYKKDPLASFEFEISDYSLLSKMINALDIPVFYILEGGYSREIGRCCVALLST